MDAHGEREDILTEIRALRADVEPLIQIVPQMKAVADIYTAGKVGGGFLKWVAGLGGLLLSAWVAIKAVALSITAH